jgi:lipoprotein-releasing system ATP-binding protein
MNSTSGDDAKTESPQDSSTIRLAPDATRSGLSVANLCKSYPTPTDPLVVLRGVSFSLNAGDRVAIVGPSGSGKSTLLNIIGTLDTPTSGTVSMGGLDPFALKSRELARFRATRIGFVFQDHHLLPQCNALENVLVPKLALGSVSKEDENKASELLAQVGLAGRATHLPAELSGGERQRVAIARALINSPGLLLCDEPTGNLDTKTGQSIGELLTTLAARTNAILIAVTHSTALAEMFPKKMGMVDGVLQ